MIGCGHHRTIVTAFERGYRVDDEGRVIAPSGRERVVGYFSKKGNDAPYGRVSLKTDDGFRSFQVHKLAAYQKFGDAAFEPGIVVRHLNGCSTDNRPANLALGSHSDNMFDRPKEARKTHALKAAAARRTLTRERVLELVAMRRAGASLSQCGAAFGLSKGQVSEIMSGKLYSELTGIPFIPRKAVAA